MGTRVLKWVVLADKALFADKDRLGAGLITLTAVIEAVQLEQITVAELHPLTYDITESRDLCDDGWLAAVSEGVFAVMHHGPVIIGYTQRAGGGVIVGVKVMFFT